MCQILFSKEKNPPREALFDSNEMNKDGFGFAWVENGTVKWDKGYESKQLTTDLINTYFSLPFPKAIHFRLATHGGVTPELTHPFPIKRGVPHDLKGSAKAVLFHNGVWHDYDDRLREGILAGTINPNVLQGGMSDSRAMAVLAQRFGEDFLDLLSLSQNKVLVLRHNTWYTYGSWTEKEGWSASSSRIFRFCGDSRDKRGRWEARGRVLDQDGFPVRGRGNEGGGRSDSRRNEVAPSEGRSVAHGGEVEDKSGSKFKGSEDSYLSHDYAQVQMALEDWRRKGNKVN